MKKIVLILFVLVLVNLFPVYSDNGRKWGIDLICSSNIDKSVVSNHRPCINESIDQGRLDEHCQESLGADGIPDCKTSGGTDTAVCNMNEAYNQLIEDCKKNLSFWIKIKLFFKNLFG